MKRNGFTMVELIFVIIIIGILSVAAIPKFGDIKDRAKVEAEYSAMTGLDSAIQGAMEFQREDFNNILVDWHNLGADAREVGSSYVGLNTSKKVLDKILKKNENLQIVAYADTGTEGNETNGAWDDVLLIKGKASDKTLGVKEADTAANGGNGKPDKNDFWVFNASDKAVDVYHYDGKASVTTTIESGEIKLIDNDAAITVTDVADQAGATTGKVGFNNGSAVTINVIGPL